MVIDRILIDSGKGHIVEIVLNTVEEEEIIVTEVTGLIIELGVDQDQEMAMEIEGMIDLIIDKVTEEKISDKIMVSKDIEQFRDISRGRDEGSRDQSRDRRQRSRNVSRNRPESESRSRSSSHVSTDRDRLRCFRCSEYDHFVRECPNAMIEDDSDQEDLDSTTLQMLAQDDSLNYAEVEGLNM